MATPSALEFAQWESEQRRAANQARMVNLATLRQEAARQRQLDAEMMFKAQEGAKDRAAALERVQTAGELDTKQEEARAKAYLARMDSQEKSRQFSKFAKMGVIRLPDESDESYVTRANKALADQAHDIFTNVDEYRRRSLGVAQREASTRTAKIAQVAMQTVAPTLSKSEQAAIAKNPAAFQLVLQNNPAATALYNSTVQRLEENTPPISAQGAIELQGLTDEAKRWETVGSKLIGDEDFAGAMQYFARAKPTALAPRGSFGPSPSEVGQPQGSSEPPPELGPPQNFAPLDTSLGSMSPVINTPPPVVAPANPFGPPPVPANVFRPMTPQEQEFESRMRLRRGVPAPKRPDLPFGTFTTPPEFRF